MWRDFAGAIWSSLAEASLRALVAAVLSGAVLWTMRARAPRVRHGIWTAVAAAMLAMPLLPRAVPPVRVAALPSIDLWPRPFSAPDLDERTVPSMTVAAAPPVSASPALRASAPLPAHASRFAIGWQHVAVLIYVAGVFVSIVWLIAGWLAMTRLITRSRAVVVPDGATALESSIVAAPLTAGIARPRIVLPANWRAWPDATLQAVLAHERDHIRRRDPLMALLTRVNRCVFWFHPLAWWLDVRVAAAAEEACDETAAAQTRATVDYARVLVEMADAVRRQGGRLAWQGIAVSGTGRLGARIDRILAPARRPMSRAHVAGVCAGCLIVIGAAAACRPAARALQPDPAVSARLAADKAHNDLLKAARAMTPADVASLEAHVAAQPDDLKSREQLLWHYSGDPFRTLDAQAIVARRAHVLWMIEHLPDSELAGSWAMRLFTSHRDRSPDPDGYQQAKQLWTAQTAKPDAPAQTFANAARFFEVDDKPLAERNLLAADARQPGKWTSELGSLYANTILGSNASRPAHVLRSVSQEEMHSEYAREIRVKLDASHDPKLLVGAAQQLLQAENQMTPNAGVIDFDVQALGVRYLERAVALDPNTTWAVSVLSARDQRRRWMAVWPKLQGINWRALPPAISAIPETERLEILPELIDWSNSRGENADFDRRDKAAARVEWDIMTIYAEDALRIAPQHPEHPMAGAAMFNAHMFLGLDALRRGDVKTALAHLDAAPGVPRSDRLKYDQNASVARLAHYLLKAGQREAVAVYDDRMAAIDVADRPRLLASAAAIRAGKMPEWYQVLEDRDQQLSARAAGR